MNCPLCNKEPLLLDQFLCKKCYPTFKRMMLHFARGIKEVKRDGKKYIQMQLELEKR